MFCGQIADDLLMRIGSFAREWVLNSAAPAHAFPARLRRLLLRWCGIAIPDDVGIPHGVFIRGRDLNIGPGTWINVGCHFDCGAPIWIGANCNIGPGVMILTSTHAAGDGTRRAGVAYCAGVVVGTGTWIGARATIMPGITIGRGCVIAAGAVVIRDTDPDGLYAGVPAVRVRDLGRPSDLRSVTAVNGARGSA